MSESQRRVELDALFAPASPDPVPTEIAVSPGDAVPGTSPPQARPAPKRSKAPATIGAVLATIVAAAALGFALWRTGSEIEGPALPAAIPDSVAPLDASLQQPTTPTRGSQPRATELPDSPAIVEGTQPLDVATNRGETSERSGASSAPTDERREATPIVFEEGSSDLQATAMAPPDSPDDVPPATQVDAAAGSPQSPPAEAQPRLLAPTRRDPIREPLDPQPASGASRGPAEVPSGATASADLDEMGTPTAEEVAPQLLRPVKPEFPKRARRLNKQVRIRVRVLVDRDGNVAEAILDSEPVGYQLDEAALAAARKFLYRAATRDGVPVEAWATITFSFKLR